VIPVECTADAVIVRIVRLKVPVSQLPAERMAGNPVVEAVRQIIARRQALVRPGEPHYRPMIRFVVQPDGQRSFYLAYPMFEHLGIPMVRQNLERPEPKAAGTPGK
jgi:hypothetical protein